MNVKKELVDQLHATIEAGETKRIAEILVSAAGGAAALLNAVSDNGFTAVYLACMRKVEPPVLSALLKHGPALDTKGEDRETPLYIATHNALNAHVTMLLGAGANVNELNGVDSETAMHAACRFGFVEVAELLIKAGANVNMRNVRMETPLFVACKFGKHEAVYQLLQLDANRNLSNEDGKNPLFIASERGQKHVVHLLKVDKQHLRDAKAQADVELRMMQPAIPTTEQLVDRAAKKAQQDKESGVVPKKPELELPSEPAVITKIEVPEDVQRTHDPLTGKAYGPCKTLEQAGYSSPQIPAGVELKPVVHPNIGGTSMKVGSGTGLKVKERPLVSQLPDGDYVDYGNVTTTNVVVSKKK